MLKARLALVSALLLAGTAPILAQPGGTPAGKAHYGSFGVDLAARDTSVKAGDDFFRYANATWLRGNAIPADRTGWSVWIGTWSPTA